MSKHWKSILFNVVGGGIIVFTVKELHESWHYALPIMVLVFAYFNYKSLAKMKNTQNDE